MSYKKLENKDYDGNIVSVYIINKETGAYIPPDPLNNDYAAYLKWVAAGNTPEDAD
tara:strand:+ start:3518 stop:3685 length:168 start_codon:yes stop_codon:yes gene_type:complete